MNQSELELTTKIIDGLSTGGKTELGSTVIESSIFETSRGRWVAITAYGKDHNPIGICDFQYHADMGNAVLESPIIRKRPDLKAPALDLRILAGDDGMYLMEGYRGDKRGTLLLTTAIEIARNYGAKRFIVKHGDIQAKWYKKLGAKEVMGAFVFDLGKRHS